MDPSRTLVKGSARLDTSGPLNEWDEHLGHFVTKQFATLNFVFITLKEYLVSCAISTGFYALPWVLHAAWFLS